MIDYNKNIYFRDELSKCRECLETLEQSRDEVFSKIPKEEENSNTCVILGSQMF